MAIANPSATGWSRSATNLFRKLNGKTAIEIVYPGAALEGADGPDTDGCYWGHVAERVYRVVVGAAGNDTSCLMAQPARLIVVRRPLAEFLSEFDGRIDLLYLDGWPVGTPEYPQRHLEAYRAAREKFHERTIVLIGDTGRDHGGKARLVLPEALEDGFQVLLWGKLTLLGRFRPAEIRDAVPRVGPPIPSEASFDEAIRLHQEEYLWEAQEHYSEKLWKSRTLLMNEGRLSPVPPASRDYFGLPEKRNLYLCFQNPLKIHPDFDPLLRGILEADPKATIALLSGTRGAAAAVLKERFHQTVGPQADRIVFLPWLKFQDYCCLLALADVVLDPPHYTASSSAYDILSFSQPTVTLPGELAVGRMGRGFHHKMHTEELVARTPEEYVATAVRVGADRDYRQCLRDRIRSASDAVFNDVEAVREHERFFAEAQPVDRRL